MRDVALRVFSERWIFVLLLGLLAGPACAQGPSEPNSQKKVWSNDNIGTVQGGVRQSIIPPPMRVKPKDSSHLTFRSSTHLEGQRSRPAQ